MVRCGLCGLGVGEGDTKTCGKATGVAELIGTQTQGQGKDMSFKILRTTNTRREHSITGGVGYSSLACPCPSCLRYTLSIYLPPSKWVCRWPAWHKLLWLLPYKTLHGVHRKSQDGFIQGQPTSGWSGHNRNQSDLHSHNFAPQIPHTADTHRSCPPPSQPVVV